MTPPLSLWLSSTMKSLYLCGSLSTMNHSASLSVALLDDEKLLSLSRWLSSAKNHSTSLSVILCTEDSNFAEDTPAERRERRKWTPIDDVVLNSLWLNTSKDPVAAYFAANPKVTGCEHRESSHSATREKSSGQNKNDVLKLAHEIFFNNHKKKFNFEHAWKELRNDQKWCDLSASKTDGSAKRRKFEDAKGHGKKTKVEGKALSALSEFQRTNRPPGVKAAKGHGKKTKVEGKALSALSEFQSLEKVKE
ncbi:hypothetical protein DY000_02020725 [Brassica cretica]|uniref:No apical meristem-associated C-terminal domain-containing protein n=1 Tax=Brassica cretica TaxID=69181 RepID=A0ABQ7E4C4_BRACR|nr:hypothetical protein DY000_02020725 [Brassica cretica]